MQRRRRLRLATVSDTGLRVAGFAETAAFPKLSELCKELTEFCRYKPHGYENQDCSYIFPVHIPDANTDRIPNEASPIETTPNPGVSYRELGWAGLRREQ